MTNRNGHYDRMEEFFSRKLSTEEFIALRRKTLAVEPPVALKGFKSFSLVRYRINSPALYQAYDAIGQRNAPISHDLDYQMDCARYGLLLDDSPLVLMGVVANIPGSPEISDVFFRKFVKLPDQIMLDVLNELDLPPSRSMGVDLQFADEYNCWFEGGKWIIREPRTLIAVTLERMCFAVSPPIRETYDVYLLEDPADPLDGGGNDEKEYWAKAKYREEGFERGMDDLRGRHRTGFTSWTTTGEPRRIKVVSHDLDGQIEGLVDVRNAAMAGLKI